MVEQAAGLGDPAVGPSFRDATRVAGANPPLWADILLANRDALVVGIRDAVARLGVVEDALSRGDREALEAAQAVAGHRREALMQRALHSGPTRELRVQVPNRPGVIAELALALGRAGINIPDMSLTPAPDNSRGEVALWVAERDYERAAGIVQDL
jgi:prephenate dehydrogenase